MFASAFQVPQQQQHLMRGNQAQQTCLPGQTSISMPLYNNPMVFSQAHPITVAAQMPTDLSERQPQSNYSQDRSLRYELALSSQTCVLLAPKLQGLFSSQDVLWQKHDSCIQSWKLPQTIRPPFREVSADIV